MNIVDTKWSFSDYPESNASSLGIFISGCETRCPGCHNHQLFNKDNGECFNASYLNDIIRTVMSAPEFDRNISIMGGEPLESYNYRGVNLLLEMLDSSVSVCLYTSKDIKTAISLLSADAIKIVKYIKCGKYDMESRLTSRKTPEFMQLASANQEMYKIYQLSDQPCYSLISVKGLIKFK